MRNAKLGTPDGYPRAKPIGPGLRVLFAVLGIAALVPVALIASTELRAVSSGSRGGALIMLAFCIVVAMGALSLLRAAAHGVAMVRRPSRKRQNH